MVSGSGANIGTYYDLQKTDVKQAILLSDWLSDTDTDIAAGSYQVGKDMNAGLYTYAIAENQAGSLQITTAEAQYSRAIRSVGLAYDTLFIPQGAYVTLASVSIYQPQHAKSNFKIWEEFP